MADTKLTPEDEAVLCVGMSALVALKQVELAFGKAQLAFTGSCIDKKSFDKPEFIKQVDEAVAGIAKFINEARVFRNLIEDGRTRSEKWDSQREIHNFGSDRALPMCRQDPKALLQRLTAGVVERRAKDAGDA